MIEWLKARRDKFWDLQQVETEAQANAYYRGQWAAYQDMLFRMGHAEGLD